MRNTNASYVLIDVANRTYLLHHPSLETVQFLQRNILDTRLIPVLGRTLEAPDPGQPRLGQPRLFYTFHPPSSFALQPEAQVSAVTRQKQDRAQLWSQGYAYLLWFANVMTETYWSTATLDHGDLNAYLRDPPPFIMQYAQAKGIPHAEASDQLAFDAECLESAIPFRKGLIWRHEQTLLQLREWDQLNGWQRQVQKDALQVEQL